MLDINALFEFSRTHCVAICAVLVPANLVATSQTLLLTGFSRPIAQIQVMALAASLYGLLLILHVLTWLAIGVVMAPTYILTFLGCLCIGLNLTCVAIGKRGWNPVIWTH
jgi:putative exporter of polyketide antibiotics